MPTDRQMHLGLFLQGAGHHVAGSRMPGAEFGSEDLPHMLKIVRIAEAAKFDMAFLADGLTMQATAHPSMAARLELLTMLATGTTHIGLAATASHRPPMANRSTRRGCSPRSITSAAGEQREIWSLLLSRSPPRTSAKPSAP